MTKLILTKPLSLATQAKLDSLKPQDRRDKVKGVPPKASGASAQKTPPVVKAASCSAKKPDTKRHYQVYLAKIKTVYQWLNQQWPEIFDLTAPKPLKRHIELDIFAHIPEHLTKTQIREGLRAYVNHPAYLKAILGGGWRFDLLGAPVEEITPEQQQYSQQQLERKIQHQPKQRKQQPRDSNKILSPEVSDKAADRQSD